MKSQGAAKNEANNAAQAGKAASLDAAMDQAGQVLVQQMEKMQTVEQEPLDLSKVKIEPLFEDMVDFDTFSKSDFRAVKIEACSKEQEASEVHSQRWNRPETYDLKRYP